MKKADREPEPAARQEGASLLPIVTAILGLVVAVQILYFFLLHAYLAITCPYQLDYGEGPILQIAFRVAQGQELYPPVDRPPYVIASYVPLYYVLCALGLKLTGPGFLFGRLLSCLGGVMVAVFAGLIVWDRTRHRFAAFLTAGTILSMPYFMVWSTLMRVDVLALGLSVAGFYFFTRGGRAAGISLFSLAVFTRRTTLAAITAAFLGCARERGLRRAARTFAVQALLIAVLFTGALILTRGGIYRQLYLHTATSVGKAWTWQQLWSLLWVSENPCPLRMYPAYFAITALAAVWSAFHRPSRPLLIYFLTACLIFLTGGRIGTTHNYLIEPTAIGAMMLGVMWAVLSRRPGPPRVALMLIGGLLAVQMVWTDRHFRDSISLSRPAFNAEASRHVVQRIREADGPVLCEDTGLTVLAGREPPLMPFEFTIMARRGVLDPAPVFRAVREGRYPLVVLRFNPFDPREMELHQAGDDWKAARWPDEIISGVIASYRLDEEASPYFLFVPKAQSGEAS